MATWVLEYMGAAMLAACLLDCRLERFQEGCPLLSLSILVDPPQEILIVPPHPGLPDQMLEGVQQR